MKILYYSLLTILIFQSCSTNSGDSLSEEAIETEQTDSLVPTTFPLDTVFFLGFKPHFSESQFRNQIILENQNGSMQGDTFSISIDYLAKNDRGIDIGLNEMLDFTLSYYNGKIFLDYKEFFGVPDLEYLTLNFCNSFFEKYILIDSLDNNLELKYEYEGELEPSLEIARETQLLSYLNSKHQKRLFDFIVDAEKDTILNFFISRNLTQDKYFIYRSNYKTVLFGYSFHADLETGFEEVNKKLERLKKDDNLTYIQGERIFESAIKEYSRHWTNGGDKYIGSQYFNKKGLRFKPRLSTGDQYLDNLFEKVENNEVAMLLNDLARLNSYKHGDVFFYFDLQFIYMLNEDFDSFQSKLKADYKIMMAPYNSIETEFKESESVKKNRQNNLNKL